jgi:hypothetical protein
MMTKDFVNLFKRKLVQLYDRGLMLVNRRQNGPCLLFAFHINRYPGFMHAVMATKIGMGQKMRASAKQDLDGARTGYGVRFVWNLDKKFWHRSMSPFFNLHSSF